MTILWLTRIIDNNDQQKMTPSLVISTAIKVMFIWFAINLSVSKGERYGIGYLGPYNYTPRAGLFGAIDIAGAVTLAVAEINNSSTLLPNDQLEFHYRDTKCDAKSSLGATVALVNQFDVIAFIGPACSPGCQSAGLLASEWNLPMISYVSTSPAMSDHKIYNTFARTNGPLSQQADAFYAIMKNFGWQHFSLICNYVENRFIWTKLCELIIEKARESNSQVTFATARDYDLITATEEDIELLLTELNQNSRSKSI